MTEQSVNQETIGPSLKDKLNKMYEITRQVSAPAAWHDENKVTVTDLITSLTELEVLQVANKNLADKVNSLAEFSDQLTNKNSRIDYLELRLKEVCEMNDLCLRCLKYLAIEHVPGVSDRSVNEYIDHLIYKERTKDQQQQAELTQALKSTS